MAASIDLKGKVAFIAGVADSTGYGWAIAKALANAEQEVLARAMDAKAAIMAEKRNMLDNEKIVFIASALCF